MISPKTENHNNDTGKNSCYSKCIAYFDVHFKGILYYDYNLLKFHENKNNSVVLKWRNWSWVYTESDKL